MLRASDSAPLPKLLYAQSARSEALQDGVVVLILDVLGQNDELVPVRVLLEPEVAEQLCPGLQINAGTAARWRQNLR
jgi:hypothetical protein